MRKLFGMSRVRQIGDFVPDIRAAARAHSDTFGSGSYFVAEHIALTSSLHRGVPTALDRSSAYGQWGETMVEFVQQNKSRTVGLPRHVRRRRERAASRRADRGRS